MCDYSLQNVKSRPAQVGDKLVTRSFGTGTNGFASIETADGTFAERVAVCVLPGTEVAFERPIQTRGEWTTDGNKTYPSKVAVFRQINKDEAHMHHDAIEMPDGSNVLLTHLHDGQVATVLQLPAAPKTESEAQEQTRLEVIA